MTELSIPFVGFERGYFLDIRCFFPTKDLIGHKILSGPCNLRCYYCHRRDFIGGDYPPITIDNILTRLREQAYFNTVVLTGGEITLYHDSAIGIMKQLKSNGITTVFSTNGSFPDRVKQMVPFANVMKIDVKGYKSQYERITGYQIYDKVMQSINTGCSKTNVEVKIILHAFTQLRDIRLILEDLYNATSMPENMAIEFQLVKDFLKTGMSEPSVERMMDMCTTVGPLPTITLLKYYGENERIFRLKDGAWKLWLEKEIPLRFNW
jgi:pyruvate-formate lyase-activating enzyme